MALTGSLTERLAEHLSQHLARPVQIEMDQGVGGGSVNDAYRIGTNVGSYFVKVSRSGRHPNPFEAEADGLRRLVEAAAFRVPAVIASGEDRDDGYLLLEWIEEGARTEAFWMTFGRSLAQLHRHSAPAFGLDRDNYIGSLAQVNRPHASWSEFFVQCRLEPLVKMARDHLRLGDADVLRCERLYGRLHSLFPEERPAFLHGDLWSGNFLCDTNGAPVLIDPAVYFGHREMDIAMSKLFGGYEPMFYTAYQDAWPLETGWEERVDLCNLYPLLVHVNLFGGSYGQQVQAILKRFT